MLRALFTILVIAALGTSLAACGRKGRPIEPDDSQFPRVYPEIKFPKPKPKPGEEMEEMEEEPQSEIEAAPR
ncbi:lipoprotein [Magnetospirillum sp. UT-4]|uniref:lipoprotein n=1 Tax=Magnetospirillum sp. UT-4 TaxID=2681467 RepID=UPI0013859E60|nr:lipoprotein [Magnetospirillum sp. UT-4]CAA7624538.1 Secreted protein (modular protein) [Magnetospirillum sp. UT-4]